MKDDVDLAGVVRFRLLRDVDTHLLEAAAQVVGKQRVAVSGQVLRREQLAGSGIEQGREFGGFHVVVAFHAHRADAELICLLQCGR